MKKKIMGKNKIIITESQYRKILNEYYDPNKLYNYNYIKSIKFPRYLQTEVNKLEKIECKDANGNKHLCVRLPQFIYQFIIGDY